MATFGESWPDALHLIGLVIEIVGVYFTASRFTQILWWQIPGAFISALWRGKAARRAAVLAERLVRERFPQLLQGVALIGLGLIIQAVGIFFGTLHKPSEVPDTTGTTLLEMHKSMGAIEQRLDGAGKTLSAIQNTVEAIETRLDSAGATLSVIPKNVEAIKTHLETTGVALSLIPNILNKIDEQMLDMRIAGPVNLSYLTGADCGHVQQALWDLGFYRGKVDEKCGGATNAAAREWQMRERRTIAPARSAEEIVQTLRTPPDKRVNTGR
jgi:hypothetical protein